MGNLNLLAYDLGASSGRAILGEFDGSTISLKELHRFSNDPVHVGGHMYWDVLRLFYEMKQSLAIAGKTRIDSIGIDTWGVDFGLLDKKGRLLGNPIHYRDSLTDGMPEAAFGIMSKEQIFDQTGLAFMKFNTLYQLLAMKNSENPIYDMAGTLLFMPDLLSYFFTGEIGTEYTIASTSQMTDPRTRNWSSDILSSFGLRSDILTPITEPCSVRGKLLPELSKELLIPSGIPVVAVASHDTASAVAAVPAESDDFAYLSSGTWSLLGAEVHMPRISEDVMAANYTNEGGIDGTCRLLKNIMGLWIFQECKREWDREKVESFTDLIKYAEASKPFIAMFDPDDTVFLPPGDMIARIQTYCKNSGQRVPETKGEITRVIFESLAMKYRWGIEKLQRIWGHSVNALHIVGGGSRNALLNQFTANVLGVPVIAGPSEATAIGTLLVQAMALGEIGSLVELRHVVGASFPTDVYAPEDTAIWQDAYGRFLILLGE